MALQLKMRRASPLRVLGSPALSAFGPVADTSPGCLIPPCLPLHSKVSQAALHQFLGGGVMSVPAGNPYLSAGCFSPEACPAFTLSPSLGGANGGGWAAPRRDPSFQRAAHWPISSAVEKKIRNICSDSAGTLQREGPWKPALCQPPTPCSPGADDGLSG